VALGYRDRPELTRERFLSDPFRDRPGARLYRTGDVARYRSDGVIEYLGRSDHQVKVRGYRVEPAEIEAALADHPSVRASAVTARKDPAGNRLVAYVRFGAEPATAAELREFLLAWLPEYMVPSLFVPIAEFPLTPNGKIDRAALPEPEPALDASRESAEAPRSAVEELLAQIWMEVLQLRRMGIREDFFELGGHSLLATRVASRIRDSFAVELPLRALFESPTIAALAERIESAQREADGIETAPLRRAPRAETYPLSFAQQRLWFVQQLEPGAAHYNVQRAIRMSGELDEPSLERALTEIVRRHESLRTTFGSLDGAPFQRVREKAAASLRIDRLDAELPEEQREAELMARAKEDRRRPFDLSRDPLLRARLTRLKPQDHVLILTLHHIVCDAWSLGVLERELSSLYGAFSSGRPSPLPDLPIQYPDYAVWQRQFLTGDTLARLLSYWRGVLGSDSSDLALSRRPRPPAQSFRGARHAQRLPLELTEKLRAIGREEGASLFMLLLAGFQALLSRETGRTDIRVGTDIANRSRVETENLIGFFVNLLVLRADLSGNPGFRELLGRVREAALGAYAHQDLPFERLVEELKPERDLSRNPLVQILFVMQNVQRLSAPPPGLGWSGVDAGTDVARFDLAVFVNDKDDGLLANWVYNTDLFDATEIRGMAERFQSLLEDVGKRPDTRLENLAMVSENEKQRLAQERSDRRGAQSARLRSMRRKGIDLSQMQEVRAGELAAGQALPLVIEPEDESLDLAEWGKKEQNFLGTSLLKHGAILFRGFGVKSAEEFERFASGLCPELFGEYGDLPRESVGGRVYGSTPYPSDQPILFHNESAHMHRWPMKIWFYCVLPSRSGGETPIVDCRTIYNRLDPALRQRFSDKGLLYVRNYTEGLDVSWQGFYGSDDRRKVEEACTQAGTEFEWTKGNGLRTRQRSPAVIRHPQTGEMSFFNQLQLHHVSFLEPAVRESLSAMMREEDLPRNVFYGDGSRIEDSVMQEILELYRATSVQFPWRAGDVLMLNNMLVAHSRNPYAGPRKIVVAMGEMVNQSELAV
jgi:alpha-ketoglutarate-dependent taurine dioxygenase/acyl carrier protein